MQSGENIGEIFICSLDEEKEFCPTFPQKVCLKQEDCKPTFHLLVEGNFQGLNNEFEKCSDHNDVSYLCPLPESSKLPELSSTTTATTTTTTAAPTTTIDRETLFDNLCQICGMAGTELPS